MKMPMAFAVLEPLGMIVRVPYDNIVGPDICDGGSESQEFAQSAAIGTSFNHCAVTGRKCRRLDGQADSQAPAIDDKIRSLPQTMTAQTSKSQKHDPPSKAHPL